MNILYTGAKGFIGGYTIQKFLNEGHTVIGIDNNWKYGPIEKSYDNHPNYKFFGNDAKNYNGLYELIEGFNIDTFIMGAALIGGISFFHTIPFDILSENELITSSSFRACIDGYKKGIIKRVIVLSSSMVFESAFEFPTKEGHQKECPPPISSYGFQKLSTEYFAKAAFDQYKLPYTIIRPFNCAGIGEYKAKLDVEIMSGNVSLAMSHVIPDLIKKILKNQYPLHILGNGNQIRHYTYGGDIANGIYLSSIKDKALYEDFNLSTDIGHTVLELSHIIWKKIKGDKKFKYISDTSFQYDVQKRIPDTTKAKNILGFNATTSLDSILNETIPWVEKSLEKGLL